MSLSKIDSTHIKSLTNKIFRTIDPILLSEGYELLDVKFSSKTLILQVFIDKDQGISMDDCVKVSTLLNDILDQKGYSDEVPNSFHLEVSSPGIYRALVKLDHFKRFLGEMIEVIFNKELLEEKSVKGILKNIDESEDVTIYVESKEGKIYNINYKSICKAKLIPQF